MSRSSGGPIGSDALFRSDRFHPARALTAPVIVLTALSFGACSHPEHSSSSDDPDATQGTGEPGDGEGSAAGGGTLALKPGADQPFDGGAYLVEAHGGGAAATLGLVDVVFGRLVDVYDTAPRPGVAAGRLASDPLDPALYESRLVHPDFLIDRDLHTSFDGGELAWELTTHPVTGDERLRIAADAAADPGRFALLLAGTTAGLDTLAPKGRGPLVAPPFTSVPRNAALSVRFDDLIDPASVLAGDAVRVLVGEDLGRQFGARIFADPNHGGVAGGRFAPTRLIVDLSVSSDELSRHEQPLPVRPAGVPHGVGTGRADLALTFPTVVNPGVGQFSVLRNLRGASLDPTASGPVHHASPTVDVVWAAGVGGPLEPYGGGLPDLDPPRVVGNQPVTIASAATLDPTKELRLVLTASSTACLFTPRAGDVVRVGPSYWVEVVELLASGPPGTVAVRVDVPFGVTPIAPAALAGSAATYHTPWRDALGVAAAPCFVEFTPAAGQAPNALVDPNAQVRVRFNESMDVATAQAFDSFYVARDANVDATLTSPDGSGAVPPLPQDLVPGTIVPSTDLMELTFVPSLPLTHTAGQAEAFFFNLVSNLADGGVADLAGNVLAWPLPQIPFSLDPAAAAAATDGWVLRFEQTDEDGLAGPDVRGQVLYDLEAGELRPRPVQRFARTIDRTQPTVGVMAPLPSGLATPLSPFGAKAHMVWRYMDAGFDVSQTNDLFYNLDLEGLSLAPIGGQVIAEVYPEFELRLGHGANLADEVLDPFSLLPKYPSSGFASGATFDEGFLADPLGGPAVVHPKALGFAVSPGDLFVGATGTTLLPLPWNQGVTEDQKTFYTWRDTAIAARGNLNGPFLVGTGAPTEQELQVVGLPGPAGAVWGDALGASPVGIPAPGLPLLMEYRCYPTDQAFGLNSFDVSLAVTSSPRPFTRAFSAGGVNQLGQVVVKDPDLEVKPTGGFNADASLGPVGAATLPTDSVVYLGQMDVVLRTSRAYTVLIDAAHAPLQGAGGTWDYAAAVIEPAPGAQPAGTAVSVAWRGSDLSDLVGQEAMLDASRLDVFGEPLAGLLSDPVPDNPAFPWTAPAWTDALDGVDGRRFVQSRFTFVGNTATLETASLDSYALAYFR